MVTGGEPVFVGHDPAVVLKHLGVKPLAGEDKVGFAEALYYP